VRTKLIRTIASLVAVAATALLLVGCNRSGKGHAHGGDAEHAHGGEDGHEHEEKTAQITVWTNGYEIFAEHKAPVVGKPTTFITHVTDLETLQPRSEGPVKFLLQQEGIPPIEHLQGAPARAGIYLPGLTFPKPGKWQVQIVVQNSTVSLGTIEAFVDEHSAAHAEFPEPPEGISFLKEQQWKILSKAEPVTKRTLIERVRVPAVVAAKPGLLASVNAPIAGRLLPAEGKGLPVIGDKVEAGQTLALLQPSFSEIGARMVEAEAEVTRAKLALDQAELAFKRIEALGKAEAKTQREVQEAEFALKNAQANYNAALSLQATYRSVTAGLGAKTNAAQPVLELKAPIAGTVVSQLAVAVGEYVSAERVLFTILDARSVFIEGKIPEANARQLSDAKGASYELSAQRGKFQAILGEGKGRLVFAGIQVDAQTRTLPLVYELPNTDGRLRIGEAVTLHVETAHAENTFAVPDSAIVEEDGQSIAFVQVAGETFEKRTLTLGIRDGNWVQVKDGLAEGERVVTKGAYAIRLASVSSVIPSHGHAH
jgi:membrane fusion protein, heavy metal efflux system